ncbi:MAG TPA: VWA domain-containing protein [Methylomusa anaerophila]|uniref:VWA domain containing CoxE-like protein n=1 Tax=Methylomusa anaerophila TaxID=1930071 RepID=A0A348AJZ6_9FIRM|nr:VWA domain-containing protein [Methylomusa anaerophila]BBB91394.1 VWA domain containing CoxE-like protein [Methylomusa anaerophila]HML90182.1 VWA domain-containing protein [Methylomusa anaerophila]
MEYLIFDIARILRQSGINVSTREIADSIQALQLLNATQMDKYALYNLLNGTMLKTEWGAGYLQRLIELYLEPDPEIMADRAGVLPLKSSLPGEAGYGEGGSGGTSGGSPLQLLIEAVLNRETDLLYSSVKRHMQGIEDISENQEEALASLKQGSGWFEVYGRIEEDYRCGRISAAEYQCAQNSLALWENFFIAEIERLQARVMSRDYLSRLMKRQNPWQSNILDSDAPLDIMSREVAKLAKRLAVKKGRRRQVSIQGRITISKSIKQAMKTGGISFKLVRTARKPSKPDLCLLCDVSNSVRRFSYFMLLFVYALQKRCSSIRSFLFIDEVLEVTDYFKEQDAGSALAAIGRLKGFNCTGFSHYGKVLHQFAGRYLEVLNKSTTVLILGDAKNNRNTVDGSEVLYKIRENAKALYWLNPLAKELWDRDDCIMEKYRPGCTGMYPCANIEQLERFVAAIL